MTQHKKELTKLNLF